MESLKQYGYVGEAYATGSEGSKIQVVGGGLLLNGFGETSTKLTGKSLDLYLDGEEFGIISNPGTNVEERFPLLNEASELAPFWLEEARNQLNK